MHYPLSLDPPPLRAGFPKSTTLEEAPDQRAPTQAYISPGQIRFDIRSAMRATSVENHRISLMLLNVTALLVNPKVAQHCNYINQTSGARWHPFLQ